MSQLLLKSEIKTENDVVYARKKARELSELLGFDLQEQTRIATAVSEIARNAYQYAKGGQIEFKVVDDKQIKFVIVVKDQGPGIENLDEILAGRYISSQGMGVGVIGAKRLMDEVDIETNPGRGTTFSLKKTIPHRKLLLTTKELNHINEKLMSLISSNPMEELQRQNHEILLAVTALNEKKDELLRLNQELEDTNRGVVALYAELDEKAEILRVANESKTSFLADMTHEFRSPLNSILSISQIIMDEAKKEKATEREKQVGFIMKAARGLSDLVNDLLDIAKIEAGKLRVRTVTFSVPEIFSTLRGLMRPVGGSSENVQLHFEEVEDFTLHTDEAKVAQILRNLISNALKYTEQGDVNVCFKNLGNGRVCFSVSDSGIGIPEKDLENIFGEFYQVDNRLQKNVKGTGLGLPLSRKLATLLGGTLHAESREGKGSTFYLELPASYDGPNIADYRQASEKPVQPQKQNSFSRKKILIVDDDESIRYSLKEELKVLNVDIREASNGEEGVQIAKVYLPDLIILDLVMPEKDGFGFIKDCMSYPATRTLPIILHTSKTLDPEEFAYLDQVTTGILPKDEDGHRKLIDAIKNVLDLRGS